MDPVTAGAGAAGLIGGSPWFGLGAAALQAGSRFAAGAVATPNVAQSRSDAWVEMAAPFIVGGDAIASADPINRMARNLAPWLIAGLAIWVMAGK